MSEPNSHEQSDAISKKLDSKVADEEQPVSPVLARLIEEVRNEGAKGPTAYDRTHNRVNHPRHNRGLQF